MQSSKNAQIYDSSNATQRVNYYIDKLAHLKFILKYRPHYGFLLASVVHNQMC